MGDAPWRTERASLDEASVRALLAVQFPELTVTHVERLGEGWDCETWLVDSTWVFRFPKRAEVQPSLARERALLPLLAKRLPVRVPVPEWIGESGALFPFDFSGYRLVPGRTWDWARRPEQPLSAFEDDLVRLLNVLHGITALARQALGDEAHLEAHAPMDWHAELLRVRPVLEAHFAVDSRLAALLDAASEVPEPFAGTPVLLHYDLAEDHVLMDDAGRILGLIDWADAGIGDPAVDMIEPTAWLGPAFLERLLARYAHPVDAGLRHRVRYGAGLLALLNLAYALERGNADRAARLQRHLLEVMLPNGELFPE